MPPPARRDRRRPALVIGHHPLGRDLDHPERRSGRLQRERDAFAVHSFPRLSPRGCPDQRRSQHELYGAPQGRRRVLEEEIGTEPDDRGIGGRESLSSSRRGARPYGRDPAAPETEVHSRFSGETEAGTAGKPSRRGRQIRFSVWPIETDNQSARSFSRARQGPSKPALTVALRKEDPVG